MSKTNKDPTSLDTLIRRRAIQDLTTEIKQAFEPIQQLFRGSTYERPHVVMTAYGSVTVRKSPDDPNHSHYVINVQELLKELQNKAVETYSVKRGDDAVAAFMGRVESLGQELEELRSDVGDLS